MCNPQDDNHQKKPATEEQPVVEQPESPSGDYYYDDATGYEVYRNEDDVDEED